MMPLSDFDNEVLLELLGTPPTYVAADRVMQIAQWPEDFVDEVFLFSGLAADLERLGGDLVAARSLRRDLQAGVIRTVVMLPDGRTVELPAERWKGSDSAALYWTGRAEVWFSNGVSAGHEVGDVYIQTSDSVVQKDPTLPDHLSPYVRFMLDLARELRITPENQVKAASLRAEIQERWPAGLGAFSGNLADAMVTLLREPTSRGR
jgi:hypothetical protein